MAGVDRPEPVSSCRDDPVAKTVAAEGGADHLLPTGMPYLTGLDGLRGLAVIGAILFHAGFSWAQGGFLGVSTFFVLSGFLITNLLIREWDNSGAIDLGRFWTRRFRRLLPAALLTLLLVALLWWRQGDPQQLAKLRWDLLAALSYLANWHFYLAGTTYASLFSAPSPLQHFWSLAIEEQFYLLFPLAAIALLRAGGRRVMAMAIGIATAASVAIGVGMGSDFDRVYYGTDTRAAELLIGALLGLWWSSPYLQARAYNSRPANGRIYRWLIDFAGIAALMAVFWCWGAVQISSQALTRGGFLLYSLLMAVIIYAASHPGWVARCLSLRPLRWIGLISYGLYLYHWPVFLLVDKRSMGLSDLPLFTLQMTVTTLIALASYHLLEMPIRRGQLLTTIPSAIGAALAGSLLVAICAILVTPNQTGTNIPYAHVRLEDFSTTVLAGPQHGTVERTSARDFDVTTRTVMLLGDLGMVDAAPALRAAFTAAGATQVIEGAYPGVGLANPEIKWRAAYTDMISKYRPDLVIMMLGSWDLIYAQKHGTSAYAEIVDEAAQTLTAQGARLLWLSMLPGGTTPERLVDRVYEQLPSRFPKIVAYADIEASLRATEDARSLNTMPGSELWPRHYVDANGETVLLRKPDFLHLCPTGAVRLAIAVNQAAAKLGWSALAHSGWELGPWRSDPRYNDPVGACLFD